jgi:predicted RNA-binding Zn ribbon-like protein
MAPDAVSLLGADATSHFRGGRLCLALVNSVYWRRGPSPEDRLDSYPNLLALADGAGWIPDVAALGHAAAERPDEAARVLSRAVDLREQLLAVFAAHAAGTTPPDSAFATVQKLASRGLAALRLAPIDHGYQLVWPETRLDLPLLQAAVSATLLLSGPELPRVKQCPGPSCGWVFLDTTRNQSRRWCDSRECGNRNRAHAHYERSRAGRS